MANIQWDDVRLFLALMRTGSLTAAAVALGVDTSTVSRRLNALEASVGTSLFVRTREGARPTIAAEELLPDAHAAEEAIAQMARVAAGLETAAEGTVRLTVPPTLTEAFIIPLLPELGRRHPKLSLEVISSTTLVDLTRREADIAIRTVRPTSGDLVFVKLFDVAYGLYASTPRAKHLGKLKKLTGVPMVGWPKEMAQVPVARWLNRFAADANFVLRVNAMDPQVVAARAGIGIAVLPRALAQADSHLAPVRCGPALKAAVSELPSEEMWLVGHQAFRRVPRVQAVWEMLRSAAARAG